MTEPVVVLSDVSFSYPGKIPALCRVSLRLFAGQKIVIMGANGSGKSTLLHLLDGIRFADSGSVTVLGTRLTEAAFQDDTFARSFRKKVGLVFQNPDVQLFCPTVKDDILFGPLQLGMREAEVARRLQDLIHVLDIAELMDRAPHQLSIGEKRKVAIASVLVMDPEILLLDEPTAGLDPLTTRHIVDLLLEAHAAGKTVIVSTHDVHIAEELADVLCVFGRDKRVVKTGAPREILSDLELLRENNLIHIHRHRHGGDVHEHPHDHLHPHH